MTDTDTNDASDTGPVLDAYAAWFGRLMRYVFYPENAGPPPSLSDNTAFETWRTATENTADEMETIMFATLCRAQEELYKVSETLLDTVKTENEKPALELFDECLNLYEGFTVRLRQVEKDRAQENAGLDPLTGLRSRQTMHGELHRELERRARQGRPLCIVLARVDAYEVIKNSLSEEKYRSMMWSLGELIKNCIRSFDDAYNIRNGEFVLSLKHADAQGGTAAIARLRRLLEREGTIQTEKGHHHKITMSYCAAEFLPGDTVDELLDNVRADLDQYYEEGDTALEHFEQSTLERYVRTSGDT